MSLEEYYTRLPEACEISDVITLILSNYPYQEVIMRNYLSQVLPSKIVNAEADIGKILKNLLEQNLSFVAVHERTEEIVGAIIILSSEFAVWQSFITDKYDEHLIAVAKLIDDMREQIYSIEDLGPDAMQFAFLTVHQYHRGNGIAKCLLQRSIDHLQALGINMIYGIFTSPRSRWIAQTCGMLSMKNIMIGKCMNSDGTFKYSNVDSGVVISVMNCINYRGTKKS